MFRCILLSALCSLAQAKFWATSHRENGRVLHWKAEPGQGFDSAPLEYNPQTDGCGVRVYLDETYRFSTHHIQHVFSLVNKTFVSQDLPQVSCFLTSHKTRQKKSCVTPMRPETDLDSGH